MLSLADGNTVKMKSFAGRRLARMGSPIEDGLKERFFNNPQVGSGLRDIEALVQRGERSLTLGAETLLFLLDNDR